MFKHNLILAFRNFKRYKSSFIINLIGLTSGLACMLFIYLWVNDELNVDKFHEKETQLYQVMEHQQYAQDIMTTTSTPGLLANELKENYPEVVYAATTSWIGDYTLTFNEKNVQAEGVRTILIYSPMAWFRAMQIRCWQTNTQLLYQKNLQKAYLVLQRMLLVRLSNYNMQTT